MINRLGLAESYEQYAARAGGQSVYTHAFWRAEGLRLLNAPSLRVNSREAMGAPYGAHPCRVAPGVAVPIRGLRVEDVIEVDP